MTDILRSSEINPQDKKDYKCAPGKIFEDGSCISLSDLIPMAEAYNNDKVNEGSKIKLDRSVEILNPKKYKRYLIQQFNKRLNKVCDSQRCWLEQDFMKHIKRPEVRENLLENTFRPVGPQGKFEWLNTVNITQVVEQYENQYPDFKFLGAVPMDFDDLPYVGLDKVDFAKLKKEGKMKIGIIFNLDEHHKPGSHWVSLYADLQKGGVYYFDSYGTAPEERVRKLMRRIVRGIKETGGKETVDYNKNRHQYGGSECGVYSINFIIQQLEGTKFQDICNKIMKDSEINKKRDIYFA